jgi:hypothetical protein
MPVFRFTSAIKIRDIINPYILVTATQAKSIKARERNLERALHMLSGRKGRFMARAWNQRA